MNVPDMFLLKVELFELWPELKRRMILTRKEHKCHWCQKDFPAGTRMRLDVGILPDKTLQQAYTCKECIIEIGGFDEDTKED